MQFQYRFLPRNYVEKTPEDIVETFSTYKLFCFYFETHIQRTTYNTIACTYLKRISGSSTNNNQREGE